MLRVLVILALAFGPIPAWCNIAAAATASVQPTDHTTSDTSDNACGRSCCCVTDCGCVMKSHDDAPATPAPAPNQSNHVRLDLASPAPSFFTWHTIDARVDAPEASISRGTPGLSLPLICVWTI